MKIKDVYPLTPLQEGIFFHWKVSNEMYFEQSSYTIKGKLEIEYLKKSYHILIARHDALRTCFLDDLGDDILQIVQNEVPSNFKYSDITKESNEEVVKIKEQDIQEGFDLTKGSQMRLTVLKLDTNIYELVWSHHHIILDGWCIGILIKEFFTIYESFIEEKEFSLPRLKPFAEYIKWLEKKDKESSLGYWEKYLADGQGLVSLPFPKKSKESYKPRELFYVIKGALKNKLTTFCKEIGVTENVFFQTLWGILLAKYNNTNDIVFGGVVSGRPAEIQGIESMIGLFINTIPVRISFDKKQTVKEVLLKNQEKAIKGLSFHFNHISEIQQVANNNQQLFDHIIVFENYPVEELITNKFKSEEKKSAIELIATEFYEGANYDFSLAILPGSEINVRFTFNSGVYNEADIENLKNHFERILNQVLETPNVLVSEIEYVSEDEKNKLLSISQNVEKKEIKKNVTLIELFENVAIEKENKIALVFKKKEYSYKKLNTLATKFASYLVTHCKIKPEDFIGVELERNDWLIIAVLGVFKSGGVYLPLDINLPKERRNYIISDSGCKVIIDEKFINEFKNYKIKNTASSEFKTDIVSSNLAYVIYTSGSTGNPKGVLVEHQNIASLFINIEGEFHDFNAPIVPLLASNSFDIFLFELFYPLVSGGKVFMIADQKVKNSTSLTQVLTKVNSFHAVPTLMRTIIDHIKKSKKEKEYEHIETICIGGDKIPSGILEEISQVFSKAAIHVLYGPTEGTIFVTKESYTYNAKQYSNKIIGKGNANNAIYVLDADLKLCPFYSVGELCISGNQVTRGYLNNPTITDLKYIENPFVLGEKLYRTGDMVKRFPSGKIEFVGRKDNQVKVRGHRIELEEIENVLLTNEFIESVIVKTITVDKNEKEIATYFTATKKLKTSELIVFLKEHLPPYMMPNYFIELEEIPLSVNGKVDRNKLPNPLKRNHVSEEEYREATSEVEIKLTEIWRTILSQNRIGINDDFFHLGGHSLKMIKLVNHVFLTFDVRIDIKEIYTENTIKKQARYIENYSNTTINLIPRAKSSSNYPLSSSQYRIWNLCALDSQANKAYNIRLLDFKEKAINKEALTKAFNDLIARHEILRTGFIVNQKGEVRQHIIPADKVEKLEINFIDLREIENKEKELQASLNKLNDRVFNLEAPPLMQVGLVCVEDNNWIIGVVIHHIIFDEWSTNVFLNELGQLYTKYDENKEIVLSPLAIQFKDYAVWEQDKMKDTTIDSDKNYWSNQFEGDLPVLSDLGDYSRPKIKTYSGDVISKSIKGGILHKLNELCISHKVTPYMVSF